MSDTPRTDAKAQFFGFNPDEGEEFVQADFARELECENSALRAERDMLSAEIDQWAARCASAIWMLPETVTGGELRNAQNKWFLQMDTLKRENVALRADKERLMQALHEAEQNMARCLDEGKLPAWSIDCLRAAIDAARKEQP